METRMASKIDLEQIERHEKKNKKIDAWDKKHLYNFYNKKNSVQYVVVDDEVVHGYVFCTYDKKHVYIYKLEYAQPEVGRKLLDKLKIRITSGAKERIIYCVHEHRMDILNFLKANEFIACGVERGAFGLSDGIVLKYWTNHDDIDEIGQHACSV